MSNEHHVNELKRTVAALERKLEKHEARSNRQGGILGLIAMGSIFGLIAYWGPMFGLGPAFLDAHSVEAWKVEAVKVQFEDPDDPDWYWGEIEGRHSTIDLRSEDGDVKISPRGIFITGPDGEIELKPQKSE